MIRALCFDAADTLIHLAEPVGNGYARVASRFGIQLDPAATTAAFRAAWKAQPAPDYQNGPASDGDRSWWRQLVDSVLERVLGTKNPPAERRNSFFDTLYAHYATPEAWLLYPDVRPVLERLAASTYLPKLRLAVLSNFDPRLRNILAGHSIAHHFDHWIISSEVGSYKPEPAIFEKACTALGLPPSQVLHIGDDPVADVQGSQNAGLNALHIDRPRTTLESIFESRHFPT